VSRIAPPAEKVLAVANIFIALTTELEPRIDEADPRVQVALIDAATRIAMATDTRDMGILGAPSRGVNLCPHVLRGISGDQRCLLPEDHDGSHSWFTPPGDFTMEPQHAPGQRVITLHDDPGYEPGPG
jgi:hypothetical protein